MSDILCIQGAGPVLLYIPEANFKKSVLQWTGSQWSSLRIRLLLSTFLVLVKVQLKSLREIVVGLVDGIKIWAQVEHNQHRKIFLFFLSVAILKSLILASAVQYYEEAGNQTSMLLVRKKVLVQLKINNLLYYFTKDGKIWNWLIVA